MLSRTLATLSCLASCTASLPDWSKNATLKNAEDLLAHHRATSGHVELPLTLLWNDRRQPMAPFVLVVVMLTVASMGMFMMAFAAARRAMLPDGTAGKATGVPAIDTKLKALAAETVPLSPSLRPTELHPTQSHVVVIPACPSPLRLPQSV